MTVRRWLEGLGGTLFIWLLRGISRQMNRRRP